jgi:group II intron reverse transcriptase/maturase
MVFRTLAHLIDVDFLKEAFRRTRKQAAPGVDGVTAAEYARDLDANLRDLYQRMRSGRYRAQPVRRGWVPKDGGGDRPIGITALDDKIAQRAVTMILEAIYEQSFLDCSYGFRPGRRPHAALKELRDQALGLNVSWVLDADISGFFDSLDHSHLREIIRRRVNAGGILRYIGKWLNAGVLDEGKLSYPEKGTPQGGVISPMLSNIFLHAVLDEWFEREVKPCMRGRCFMIRFADDFVIGFEREDDARRMMDVLPRRFARFGLTIHPDKTRLVSFRRPRRDDESGGGSGTFDFLGFTHYWARSRRGNWVIKRKTRRARLSRALKAAWQWCRRHRHVRLTEQYRALCSKLRGHYQYYGIRGNYRALQLVYQRVRRAWHFWLSRRCSKGHVPWEAFEERCRVFRLPTPRIVHCV